MPRWTLGVLEMVKTLNRRRRTRWKPPSIRKHVCHKKTARLLFIWIAGNGATSARAARGGRQERQQLILKILVLTSLFSIFCTNIFQCCFICHRIQLWSFSFEDEDHQNQLGWFGTDGLTKTWNNCLLLLNYWLSSSSSSSPPEVYPLFTMPPAVLGNCGLSLRATCSRAFNQSRFQYIITTW